MKKVLVTLSLAALVMWAGAGVASAALSKISGNTSDDGIFSAVATQKNSFKIDNSNYANVEVYTESEAESGENQINVGEDGESLYITTGATEASSQTGLDVNSLEIDSECCGVLSDEAEVIIDLNEGDDMIASASTDVLYEEEVINSNTVDFYVETEAEADSGDNEANVGEDANIVDLRSGASKSDLIKTDFLNWFKWAKTK